MIHSPLFVVRILQDATDSGIHVGAVAPVKVAKTSVARHRVRRRIYEAARSSISQINPGISVIFFAKQLVIETALPDLKRAIHDIFVKAGLLR